MKKKVICTLITASMAASFMSFNVLAANADLSTGVLYWDFENIRQIAPPQVAYVLNNSTNNMTAGECYWEKYADNTDGIDSGAWSSMDPLVGINGGSMPIVHVGMNEIYAKNGNSGYDNPEQYYPTRLYPNALADAGKVASFLPGEVDDNGNYCIAALSKNNAGPRVLGSCIKLSDTELIPGQKYKFECDAYVSYPTFDGLEATYSYALYAGFGVPSARKTSRIYRGNGGRPELNVPYCFDGQPKATAPSSPDNARVVQENLPDEQWVHCGNDWLFYAPESAYENHETVFYVGLAYFEDGLGAFVNGGTKLFVDNIKLTPVDNDGNPISELSYSTASLRTTWDFEDETACGWSGLVDDNTARTVENTSVAAVDAVLNQNGIYGQIGIADGSRCIGINKRNQDKVAGIKVYLEQAKFQPGDYTLKLRVVHPQRVVASERLYAAVYPGKWTLYEELDSAVRYNSYDAASTAANGSSMVRLPGVSAWWEDVTCDITIDESDFVDGYATLALLTERVWGIYTASDAAAAEYYNNDARTYYDEISLTCNSTEMIEAGTSPTVSVDMAYYGSEPKSAIVASSVVDSMADQALPIDISAKCADAFTGQCRVDIPIEIDENADIPFARVFAWEKNNLKPFMTPVEFGFSFD